MSYRDTASFGKRQEYSVIAELLKRGFDVYLTLVDDQGIDCVIRLDHQRYLDIQIKARSQSAQEWNRFAALSFEIRDNFFFIFYLEKNNTYWVIPSRELVDLCFVNRSGVNAGRMTLILPKLDSTDKASKFERYKNNNGFKLLETFGSL
ncbi:MAG: hypothetical protein HS126_09435 [Anaerolineales bacterium]|nr:hypothetical protein [Anaerolineales bacterium]